MGANLQPPAFLEGPTALAGREWSRGRPEARRGGARGNRVPPGPRRVALAAEIPQVPLPKSSRKPKLLPHNLGLTRLLPRHTLRPAAPPSQRGRRYLSRRPEDPKSHLIQRAARGRLQSPGSMAPSSPSRNFPDIALLSAAAENNASRQRRRRRWWLSRRRWRELEQKVGSIAAAERRRLPICRGFPPPG